MNSGNLQTERVSLFAASVIVFEFIDSGMLLVLERMQNRWGIHIN